MKTHFLKFRTYSIQHVSLFCFLLEVSLYSHENISYFPFGFEGRMWDLIVLVPDHCLSFYFTNDMKRLTDNVDFKVHVVK